jgi:hypothetical protein
MMLKKKILPFLLILIYISTLPIVNASISSYNWVGETHSGYDPFFEGTVTAYQTESEATVLVTVYNNYWVGAPFWTYQPINISAVKICPDWNMNYTTGEVDENSPLTIEPLQYHTFTITFTIPNIIIASNLVAHDFSIYVEHVNSTIGVKKLVDTWISSGSNLAVYSPIQTIAQEIAQKYASLPSPTFNYPEAEVLWSQAMLEGNIAQASYMHGQFIEAEIHYQAMDDLVTQAFTVESNEGSKVVDTLITHATAHMIQSYGFIVLGLGVILLGIGMIIYIFRRK